MKKSAIALVVAGGLLLSGCQSAHHVSQHDRNQFVTEFYAFVHEVRPITFDSNVDEAMATGALVGALEHSDGNREEIIGGALLGALFSGLITRILEGSPEGYEYLLAAVDGDIVTVVSDYDAAELGDCVRVRVAGDVTIERRPLEFCDTTD